MRASATPMFTAAFLVFLAAAVVSAQEVTLVVQKSGGRIEEEKDLRLTLDTFKKVEARQGRARLSLNPSEVIEIRFDKGPEAWKKGYSAFKDNEFPTAIGHLKTALESAKSYPWLTAYANFYLGQSLRSVGALDDAAEALNAMIKAAPDHRLIPKAWDTLGQIAMLRGESGATEAKRAFSSLQGLVEKEGLDRSYLVTAKRGLATIEARFGSASGGRAQLQSLLSEAQGAEANLVRLEIGRSLNRERKFDEAESFFKAILEKQDTDAPDPIIIAGASNGLGDAEYYRNQYDAAGTTFSRVYGLFSERDDMKTYVAHALFYGGQAFELQSGKEADAAKKKLLKRRGNGLIRRAASDRYQATPAGAEARKHLGF